MLSASAWPLEEDRPALTARLDAFQAQVDGFVAKRSAAVDREQEVGAAKAERCQIELQLRQLREAEQLRRRVDAASGTESPAERRRSATAKILLDDARRKSLQRLEHLQVTFTSKRDCNQEPGP